MTLTPPTIAYFTQIYLNLVKSYNATNDISQYTDYQTKGQVLGGVIAGASQDAYSLFNNNYPQYANSQGINLGLAAAGVPVTFPATQAQLTTTANNLEVDEVYNVPLGTLLTAPNGTTYKIISSVNSNLTNVIVSTINPTIYVASTKTGSGTGQPVTTVLTFSPPIVSASTNYILSFASVIASADGSDVEPITNATTRLVNIKQTPLCGTRSTDFKYLAINQSNGVVDAVVLINNRLKYNAENYNLGVYDVSGNAINNTILNQGLLTDTAVVYSRQSTSGQIATTQATIDNQNIVGVFPIVSTVATQQITTLTGTPNAFFKINVTLQPGYALSSQISLPEGVFTIIQLIQREVRRSICETEYGGILTYNSNTGAINGSAIAVSAIEQQLDVSLGTNTTTGTIGNYLQNREVLCWNGSAYVYTPTITIPYTNPYGVPVNPNDYLYWIYDISTTAENIYANIIVGLL
jgi:hypothetical protein